MWLCFLNVGTLRRHSQHFAENSQTKQLSVCVFISVWNNFHVTLKWLSSVSRRFCFLGFVFGILFSVFLFYFFLSFFGRRAHQNFETGAVTFGVALEALVQTSLFARPCLWSNFESVCAGRGNCGQVNMRVNNAGSRPGERAVLEMKLMRGFKADSSAVCSLLQRLSLGKAQTSLPDKNVHLQSKGWQLMPLVLICSPSKLNDSHFCGRKPEETKETLSHQQQNLCAKCCSKCSQNKRDLCSWNNSVVRSM